MTGKGIKYIHYGFPQEKETAFKHQDKALERIEQGVSVLKDVAGAMGEELRHQEILLDTVDEKVTDRKYVSRNNENPYYNSLYEVTE